MEAIRKYLNIFIAAAAALALASCDELDEGLVDAAAGVYNGAVTADGQTTDTYISIKKITGKEDIVDIKIGIFPYLTADGEVLVDIATMKRVMIAHGEEGSVVIPSQNNTVNITDYEGSVSTMRQSLNIEGEIEQGQLTLRAQVIEGWSLGGVNELTVTAEKQ